MEVLDWGKVGMFHGITGRNTLGMIISEHLTEEVDGLVRSKLSVCLIPELLPFLLRELTQSIIVVTV